MSINRLSALAALALISCGDKDADDTSDDNNDVTSCEITAASIYPSDGQSDFYYRSVLEFELSEADSSASVSLADSAGAAVDGASALNDDQDEIVFTPTAPLAANSDFVATITWCSGERSQEIPFSTSDLGAPLSDPGSLVGNTYAIGLDSGRFVEPAALGSLISGLASNKVLLSVTASDASSISFRGAISNEDNDDQDVCNPTLDDFPAADFSGQPFFELDQPDGIDISVSGFDISIAALNVSGTFAADGSYFGGGTLSGELDARDLTFLAAELGLDTEDPDKLCGLLAGLNIPCQACSSDGATYCASIYIDQIVADETGDEVLLVEQENCFEGCAASCDNAECKDAETFAVCN